MLLNALIEQVDFIFQGLDTCVPHMYIASPICICGEGHVLTNRQQCALQEHVRAVQVHASPTLDCGNVPNDSQT